MPQTPSVQTRPPATSPNLPSTESGWRPAVLFCIALVLAGVYGFLQIAERVDDGRTTEFDEWALIALRNPDDLSDPIGPGWFEVMARDFTGIGGVGFLTLLTLLTIIYLILRKRYPLALLVAVAIGLGIGASTLLKAGYNRPRPALVPHETLVTSSSFPSGHSMMSAIVFLTLGGLIANTRGERRLKTFFIASSILLAVLVGLSRIYLGVHYPTDVLAGWLAGATWAIFFVALARSLHITCPTSHQHKKLS